MLLPRRQYPIAAVHTNINPSVLGSGTGFVEPDSVLIKGAPLVTKNRGEPPRVSEANAYPKFATQEVKLFEAISAPVEVWGPTSSFAGMNDNPLLKEDSALLRKGNAVPPGA